MPEPIIIHHALPELAPAGTTPRVPLVADRLTLAKRRWRGVAADGREFGFDLEAALGHGALFFGDAENRYVLEQAAEEVLEIPIATLEEAAFVAWNLGNLHFGAQVLAGAVRVADDPAVRQFLAREFIACRKVTCVFQPLSAGAHQPHNHGHGHDHTHAHE